MQQFESITLYSILFFLVCYEASTPEDLGLICIAVSFVAVDY